MKGRAADLARDRPGQVDQRARNTRVDASGALGAAAGSDVEEERPVDATVANGLEPRQVREHAVPRSVLPEPVALADLCMPVAVRRIRELDRG